MTLRDYPDELKRAERELIDALIDSKHGKELSDEAQDALDQSLEFPDEEGDL